MPDFNFTSLFIVGAVGTYILGFLFRSPVYIRLLVVLGSIFYACYYWIAVPTPLWDAIIGSLLIAVASGQGIVQLYWSRQPGSVRASNRDVFEVMPEMEPGLFNRLMTAGSRVTIETSTLLTREGARPEALWFLVSGQLSLERADHPSVLMTRPGFIGEVAWMLKDKASATVVAHPGAELVRWDHADLARATRKSQRLEMALEAAIAVDIAQKLSRSRPIEAISDPIQAQAAGS